MCGFSAIVQAQTGPKFVFVTYGIAGYPLIEVYGDTVWTFRTVHYIVALFPGPPSFSMLHAEKR